MAADPGRPRNRLAWIDRDGTAEMIGVEGEYGSIALSPNGRLAAVTSIGPIHRILIYDFSTGLFTPLPAEESSQFPSWHPEGNDIFYRGTRSGFRNIYRRAANGSGSEEKLTDSENLQTALSVSEGWLIFGEADPSTGGDIWKLPVDGSDAEPEVFLNSQDWEADARLSPDGRSVAYSSGAEPEQSEVFVVPFPEAEPRRLVGVGRMPVWSADGRELFFLSRDGGSLWVADVIGSGTAREVRNARVLMTDWPGLVAPVQVYDAAADGRFLGIVPVEPPSVSRELNVVLGWFDELKARVPPP